MRQRNDNEWQIVCDRCHKPFTLFFMLGALQLCIKCRNRAIRLLNYWANHKLDSVLSEQLKFVPRDIDSEGLGGDYSEHEVNDDSELTWQNGGLVSHRGGIKSPCHSVEEAKKQ